MSLRDLRLKNNLFRKLNLPFDLKLGIIKSLVLEVPWARLASSPVVCKLDQLYLVLSPQRPSDWQMQDVTTFEFKEAKLREYLQRHLSEAAAAMASRMAQEMEAAEAASGSTKGTSRQKQVQQQAGYFERYVMRIKDNLQVAVTNVHVRLEDQQERPETGGGQGPEPARRTVLEKMCIGVTLRELTLRTTESSRLGQSGVRGPLLGGELGEPACASDEEESDADSEEARSQAQAEAVPASEQRVPTEQAERAGEGANAEAKASSRGALPAKGRVPTAKKAGASASKAAFFDRTAKENRGAPLLKEFSV